MAELVEVIQADRDAAADWYERQFSSLGSMADMRKGELDDNALVQAFARHRLATRPPASGVAEELREALEPFARVADAFDYWCAEAMPEFRYPASGVDTTLALEDYPNAVGELDYHDFRRARTLAQALGEQANRDEGEKG